MRVLYDDTGMAAYGSEHYKFSDGVTALDIPGPSACGQGADGLVQYNGGFIVREPTCATISVAVENVTIAEQQVAFAGGHC